MKTIILFPGSFNPFHIGHMNILVKAERIFGRNNVVVAIGINPDKYNPDKIKEEIEERSNILSKKIKRSVIVFTEFLHELVQRYESDGYKVILLRGLRNSADLEYDIKQMKYVHDFKPNIDVVYITCDSEYEHVSSSDLKKIKELPGGDKLVNRYLI